ncbi:MAG: hypothetical protein V4525_10970 [Pseudomonadota bacterium]
MTQLTRKRLILAKIESSYNTDPTPAGVNAILVRADNLTPTPLESDYVPRNVLRAYLGGSDQLPAAVYSKIEFEVELAGAGTAGNAAPYGVLLRMCGFAETLNASAVSGTAQTGSTTTTLKLAAGASASDDVYSGLSVSTTSGTGTGQTRQIIDYVGSSKIATLSAPWTVTPDNTTAYSVNPGATYSPVSTAFESGTIYFNNDGVLHKMTGCRGTVSMMLKTKDIPTLKFTFTGLYTPATDTSLVTPDYSGFQKPLAVNNGNTPLFSLLGYTARLSELSVDLGASIQYRNLVGVEEVDLTDRDVTGKAKIEATSVASKDWWTATRNVTTGTLALTHGLTDGNKVFIGAGRVQVMKPTYSDEQSVQMLEMDLTIQPIIGNDELYLCIA